MTKSPIERKALILQSLWFDQKGNEFFEKFIKFNDLALPLAYCLHNGIITTNPEVEKFVDSAFNDLLTLLGYKPDQPFCCLEDLLFWLEPDNLILDHNEDCEFAE